jgi:hypothetical protein
METIQDPILTKLKLNLLTQIASSGEEQVKIGESLPEW